MEVQSQFIEMFYNDNFTCEKLKAHIEVIRGVSYKPTDVRDAKDKDSSVILRSNNIFNGLINYDDIVFVDSTRVSEAQELSKGDIVMCGSNGSKNLVGKAAMITEPPLHKTSFGAFCLGIRCKDTIHPMYLSSYFQTSIYRNKIEELGAGSNILNIKPDYINNMEIPVPRIEQQLKFVSIAEQADKSKFVGFKSQFIEMFGNPLSDVQKYGLKKLGECCELNPRRPRLNLEDSDMVSFVPMPSVSENGHLVDVADEEYGKVKKGFTYFENNDVLFAKITPCMENGKGTIAQDLTNGIGMGSTEFHVLRPINNISNAYWLLALTRMPIFRERASKNMSGTGGQKRVGAAFLENFLVGLPPIGEQQAFEAIYKQADKSKLLHRKSIKYSKYSL